MKLYYTRSKRSRTKNPQVILNGSDFNNNVSCGMCGCDKFEIINKYSDVPLVHFVRCAKCGGITYDKIPKQEVYDKINGTESYYDDYEEVGNSQITFYGAERIATHIINLIEKNGFKKGEKNNLSILDFGGGSGEIAYTVAKMLRGAYKNIEIVVVDYTDKLYKQNDNVIKMEREFPLEKIEDRKFDIIIASAVIEHIPAPGKDILRLFNMIKENGFLYFRAPYFYPIYNVLKKFGIEFDIMYPHHVWDLDDKWWDKLTEILNISDAEIVVSKPSIVEKSFKSHPLGALVAYIMKAPRYLFKKWKYVGGWEAVYLKK